MSTIPFGPPPVTGSNPLQVLPDPGVTQGSNLDASPHEIPAGMGRFIQDALLDVPGVVRQRGPINTLGGTYPSFPSLPSNFRTIGITSLADPNGTDSFRVLLLGVSTVDGSVHAYIYGRGAVAQTPAFHARAFFELADPVPYDGSIVGDPTIYFDDRRTSALSIGSQLVNLTISGLTILNSNNDPFFDAKVAFDGGVLVGMGTNYGPDSGAASHRTTLHWRGAGKATYSTGTVTVTQSSKVVTGAGTSWLANTEPGMFLLNSTGEFLGVVKSVDSNTQVTLERNVLAVTAAGANYSLVSLRKFIPSTMVNAGSITASTTSAVVNGGNTKFTDQKVSGGLLFRASDFTYIGTVTSVQSNIQLTLTANAAVATVNEDYVIVRPTVGLNWSAGQVPVFSAFWNGIQLAANADNRREDSSERSRIFVLGPDVLDAVDLTKTGTFYDLPATKPNTDIRGIFPTESAALVFLADTTYGLFGNDPTGLVPKVVLNGDGLLSPMTIQGWQGGAVWAGHKSVYWYDGSTVQDLLKGRAARAHQQALAGIDYGKFRAWSMLHNGHYVCFLSNANPTVFAHDQGRVQSDAAGGTQYTPSSIVYNINLETGALTFWTNVSVRGYTSPPGRLVDDRDAYYVVESTTTLGPAICSAESLFQDSGTAGYVADQILTNPANEAFAPHFYVEGRLNDFGDAERLKLLQRLLVQYSLYGGSDSTKLGIDIITGLGEASSAIAPKVRTATSVSSPVNWKNKQSRFGKKSTHVGFRFYTMADGSPAAVRLGPWSVGFKLQRPGRV